MIMMSIAPASPTLRDFKDSNGLTPFGGNTPGEAVIPVISAISGVASTLAAAFRSHTRENEFDLLNPLIKAGSVDAIVLLCALAEALVTEE